MRVLILALTLTVSCFGQGKKNLVETGVTDAHAATWIPPHATFASPPVSPPTGSTFLFTDASATGTCGGTGTALATCRWSGTAWQAVGGAGGGVTSPCTTGTISSANIAALSGTQNEITIQTAVSGDFRFEQILISETTKVTGAFTGLTVSMGRAGANNDELTGVAMPLMVSAGDANFWSARPSPPQLTGTYNVVLGFAATGANLSTIAAGALKWEICGYANH